MSVLAGTGTGFTRRVSADSGSTGPLRPQNLAQRRAPDLQLLGRGLARAQDALQLVAGPAQGLCGARGAVALAPGENLDGQADRRQRQRGAVDRPWTLD